MIIGNYFTINLVSLNLFLTLFEHFGCFTDTSDPGHFGTKIFRH